MIIRPGWDSPHVQCLSRTFCAWPCLLRQVGTVLGSPYDYVVAVLAYANPGSRHPGAAPLRSLVLAPLRSPALAPLRSLAPPRYSLPSWYTYSCKLENLRRSNFLCQVVLPGNSYTYSCQLENHSRKFVYISMEFTN